MIKYKTFYDTASNRTEHDSDVKDFICELCAVGHTFISVNTIAYGTSQGYLNNLRTEIVYKENPTRKVITEKTEQE